MDYTSDFGPIPKNFHCFETGEPFRNCSLCDYDLFENGTNYLIEKAFKKKETIFEYAACYDCYLNLHNSLSKKSRKLIANYFDERIDLEKRGQEMLEKHGRRSRSWLSRCLIKGTEKSRCEEHQIYGWFIDKDIVYNGMPYMLSSEVIEEIMQLLSPETLCELNTLTDKLFGIDFPQGILAI